MNFNEVYCTYHAEVEKYVKSKVYPHTEIADEITDDIFMKIYHNINITDDKLYLKFDPEKSSLKTWIYNITKNRLIDYFRENKREKETKINYLDSKGHNNIVHSIVSDERADCNIINDEYNKKIENVKQALTKLDIVLQKVAELRYFKQYKYDEIATELNMPMGTVKINIHRIQKYLVKNTELV